MGSLACGDSEGALFEEGAQTGVGDRTKALVAAPVCAVRKWGIGSVGADPRCLPGRYLGRVSGAATGAVDAVKPWRACHR